MEQSQVTGLVTEVERYAIHDGSGIRTTVFLKGCPLRCRWCCNPETQLFPPEPSLTVESCRGCGACMAVCPAGGKLSPGGPVLPRGRCTAACGESLPCAAACLYGALTQAGRCWSVPELMERLKRDVAFYDATGGGVTLSGGEPMCQPEFALGVLRACRELYIGTAMETCGAGAAADYERAAPLLDTVFIDVKSMDGARFLQWTGRPLEPLLQNVRLLSAAAASSGTKLYVRVPVVPGFNETPEQGRAIARFAAKLPHLDGVELLPYHKLGRGKYKLLGREYPLQSLEPPAQDTMEALYAEFSACGVPLVSF